MDDLIRLYSATDVYIVGSRVEGGPQSILECAIMNIPIVSTDVGIASEILSRNCIIGNPLEYNLQIPNKKSVRHALKQAKKFAIASHIRKYDELFENIVRG